MAPLARLADGLGASDPRAHVRVFLPCFLFFSLLSKNTNQQTCLTDDESECYDACFRGHHHRCQQRCGRPETQKCISECHRNCELLQATLTSETQATQEATTAPKKPDEKKGDNVESFLHYSRSQDAKRIHAAISHKKQKHHMSAQLRHELNPSTYGLKDHTDSDDKEFDNDESRKKFQAIMSQYRVEASNPAANTDPSPSPSLPSSSSSQMAASAKDGDEDGNFYGDLSSFQLSDGFFSQPRPSLPSSSAPRLLRQ